MIPQPLIDEVRDIRVKFLKAMDALDRTSSFQTLLNNSEKLRGEWDEVRKIRKSSRIQREVAISFTCAVIGSSSHGKTSILAEMFPSLAQRGWLITDVTDTTSQALTIRSGQADGNTSLDEVVVQSWNMPQIRRLVEAADAENRRLNIYVAYRADVIEVDGEQANFAPEERRQFRFGVRQELRPLSRPYQLTKAEREDQAFIRAITVKESSDRVRTEPVLTIDGQAFHVLQLRAAVKAVELRDSFQQIAAWSRRPAEDSARLIFIDTPGLNVVGSLKDEVLRSVLGRKNQQIIVELLRDDELDVIVHLVLAGQQSAFAHLWGPLHQVCDPEDLADLSERLVLAINGMNIYFTNDDIRRRWEGSDPAVVKREGDQFAVTLESNILNKMSEVGAFRPARVCFLDSRRIVESTASGRSYQDVYAGYRQHLQQWANPDGVGYDTLQRLGIVESFRENIEALCDPADRGQGFLVRQIHDLLNKSGSRLFVRKHLVRSKLTLGIRRARVILSQYYDAAGKLDSWQTLQQVVRNYFPGINTDDPLSIDSFYEKFLREKIDQLLPEATATVNSTKRRVLFKLTDKSLHSLRAAGVTDAVLSKLKDLKEKEFDNQDKLLNELTKIPVLDNVARFRNLVLRHTKHCVWVSDAYTAICQLLFNVAVDAAARFQLTEQSLNGLRAAGMSKTVLSKLHPFKGKKPTTRRQFESDLARLLTVDELRQCQTVVLKQARIASTNKSEEKIFQDYCNGMMNRWIWEWGYKTADLPAPTPQHSASGDLLRHSLHLHVKEMIYQLVAGPSSSASKNILQDDQDRERMRSILQDLEQADRKANNLCKDSGGIPG